MTLFSAACSSTIKKETEKSIEKVVVNEATIVLHQNSKGKERFPLKDTINISLESIETSSGSCSSLNLTFAENDGGRVNSFDLFLPAAPQLKWHQTRDGGFELYETKLPYTLHGDNYVPYKDALRDTEIRASAYLQSIIKSPDGTAMMYFRYNEITIISMDFKDGKANLEMNLKLVSEQMSDPVYGSYNADVHFVVKNFASSMMMVD
ncbi:MAG: hypothetical protein A2W93_02420 [Bacteroidetes bacterium GWF2_43_63]|nr:MAG: hypothetical protein A2W94_08430 [Bacteroidetes bacterium GWE2_42_42]OFY53528.1 MAG: hypothetical protein A2W93_02420 [Bacteroidetes bacterium GWF2_43_63]HCB63723.1 hypothetical protein [Bacteroidales bacterium]HCY24472.1 hypothetical protein [Bacteroidales bacterium]